MDNVLRHVLQAPIPRAPSALVSNSVPSTLYSIKAVLHLVQHVPTPQPARCASLIILCTTPNASHPAHRPPMPQVHPALVRKPPSQGI